jgi:phosphoglycerate dehydrogenase-like enzyme
VSSAPWRVLVLAPTTRDRAIGWLDGFGGWELDVLAPRTQGAARQALAAAEIVIGDWSSMLRVGPDEIAAAPRLAFVQMPGVGVDSLDVDVLAAAGIPVANTAGRNATSVAEWCLAAALALSRDLSWVDAQIRAGAWPQLELVGRGNREILGRSVGVIGFGPVGQATARLFAALGASVGYWTRTPRAVDEAGEAQWRPLDELVAAAEILVVNIALAPETAGLLGRERLERLPHGAIVIDASRGRVVDHAALLALVDAGRLRGAAIDVFETEPLPADSPLRRSNRVLLSSHAASVTREAIGRMFGLVGDNIRRAIAGEPVVSVINGVDPRVRRRPGAVPD